MSHHSKGPSPHRADWLDHGIQAPATIQVPDSFNWAVDADGDWGNPTNWGGTIVNGIPVGLPTDGSTVNLASPHAHTVAWDGTYFGTSLTLNSLNATTDLLAVGGGTLVIANASLGAGLDISFGILSVTGSLVTGGTSHFNTLGAYSPSGELQLGTNGGLAGSWMNSGTIYNANDVALYSVQGGTTQITNLAGGDFEVSATSTTDYNEAFYLTPNSIAIFTNAGTLTQYGLAAVENFNATILDTGTINVTLGILQLDGGGTLAGVINGPGTLALAGNGFGQQTFTMAAGLTGNGTLALTVSGELLATGAHQTLALAVQSSGTITIAAGDTLTLSSTVEATADAANNIAHFDGPGTVTTTGNVVVDVTPGRTGLFLADGVTWVNTGTVTEYGGILINPVNNSDSATLQNKAGALFDITGSSTGIVMYYPGTDSFSNAGTLEDSSANGSIGALLTNTGLIDVLAGGTLSLSDGGTLGGTLVDAGVLALGNNGTGTESFVLRVNLTGTGFLSVTAGATLLASAAHISVSPSLYSTGTLSAAAGDTLTLAGAAEFGRDAANNIAHMVGPGTITTAGATIVDASGGNDLVLASDVTWVNRGTVTDLGTILLNPVNNADTVNIINLAGAVFNIAGASQGLIPYYPGTDSLSNAGTLEDSSASGTIGAFLTNTGLINVAAGGTLNLSDGGTLGGTLSGAGTLALASGNFGLSGNLAGTGVLAVLAGASLNATATQLSLTPTVRSTGTVTVAATDSLTLSGGAEFGADAGHNLAHILGPGTLVTAGTTNVDATYGGNGMYVGGGIRWVNTGTVTDNGTILLNVVDGDSSQIVNAANAVFNLAGANANIEFLHSGTDSFSNAGTLEDSGGSGTLAADLGNTGVVLANGGTLTLSGNVTNLAAGTLSAGTFSVLSGGAGAGLYLAAGPIRTDAANISLSGASAALGGGGVALENSLTNIAAAGALHVLGGRAYSTSLALHNAGLLDLGGGVFAAASLSNDAGGKISGNGTITAAITNSGTITALGGTLDLAGALAGAGVLVAGANAMLDLSAAGTLPSSITGAGTLRLDAAESLNGTISIAHLLLGALGSLTGSGRITGSASNGGTILASGGSLTFLGNVTNQAGITAGGGAIAIDGNLSGGGTIGIGESESISLLKAAAATQTVDFLAATGLLSLGKPSSFAAHIDGFGGADQIQLINTLATSLAFANGVLTVKNGNAVVARLHFDGSYTSNSFSLGSDGHNGSLISFT